MKLREARQRPKNKKTGNLIFPPAGFLTLIYEGAVAGEDVAMVTIRRHVSTPFHSTPRHNRSSLNKFHCSASPFSFCIILIKTKHEIITVLIIWIGLVHIHRHN